MSEARDTYPRWAYKLEKALFHLLKPLLHALFFALCGPVVAFLGYLLLSEAMSFPRVGVVPAVKQMASAVQLLGTVYMIIAFGVIGPLMFMTGAIVALVSRFVLNERTLTWLGFAAGAAMALAFSRITGIQEGSRLPLPWTGPLAIVVSGLTSSLLVWSTRFLRSRGSPSAVTGSEAVS